MRRKSLLLSNQVCLRFTLERSFYARKISKWQCLSYVVQTLLNVQLHGIEYNMRQRENRGHITKLQSAVSWSLLREQVMVDRFCPFSALSIILVAGIVVYLEPFVIINAIICYKLVQWDGF